MRLMWQVPELLTILALALVGTVTIFYQVGIWLRKVVDRILKKNPLPKVRDTIFVPAPNLLDFSFADPNRTFSDLAAIAIPIEFEGMDDWDAKNAINFPDALRDEMNAAAATVAMETGLFVTLGRDLGITLILYDFKDSHYAKLHQSWVDGVCTITIAAYPVSILSPLIHTATLPGNQLSDPLREFMVDMIRKYYKHNYEHGPTPLYKC